MDDDFRKAALDYHRLPRPGKLEVAPTKRMATQRDLALAYSPGVAAACEEIKANPLTAFDYTARGNLVGVVSNGTAVLGLGTIADLRRHQPGGHQGARVLRHRKDAAGADVDPGLP